MNIFDWYESISNLSLQENGIIYNWNDMLHNERGKQTECDVYSMYNIIYKWHLKIIDMVKNIDVVIDSKHNPVYYGIQINRWYKFQHKVRGSNKLSWNNYCAHEFTNNDEITVCLNLKQQYI